MPSVADVFLRLRIDPSRLKRDVQDGVKGVDTTAAGQDAGAQFGDGFKRGRDGKLRDAKGRFVTDADAAKQGKRAGTVFGDAMGKQMRLSLGRHLQSLGQGIGPGILGLSLRNSSILGLGGAALGAVPALVAGAAPLLLGGLAAGASGLLFGSVQGQVGAAQKAQQALATAQRTAAAATTAAGRASGARNVALAQTQVSAINPAISQISAAEQSISKWWKGFTDSLAPALVGPVREVAGLLKSLGTPLTAFFKASLGAMTPLIAGFGQLAKQLLPALTGALKAAGPLLAPLLKGIGGLLGGIVSGLTVLLKAAGPGVKVLADAFALLGRGLGGMLSAFAPVVSVSAVLLKAILGIVAALLPVVGQLAGVFARELAPIFKVFASTVQALAPFLVLAGQALAELAGAILGAAAGALKALADILKGIAPTLGVFVKALGAVFVTLENSGTFAVLGDAIEKLAGPIANLINAILKALIPALPVLLQAVTVLINTGILVLAAALGTVIGWVTQLVNKFPALVPLIVAGWLAFKLYQGVDAIVGLAAKGVSLLGDAATSATAKTVVAGVRQAATWVATGAAAVASAARAAAAWVAAEIPIVASFVAQAAAATAAFIAENIATLGIIAAIAALVGAIIYVSTHWSQVWGWIKAAAKDAWNFIVNGIGKFLLPLLGPAGLLVLGIIEVWQNWKSILKALVDFVINDFVLPVTNALLDLVGFMLHGLADAFGWIPGLGGKLQAAARAFDTFKDQVNASLHKIVKSVNVDLTTSGSGQIVIKGTGIGTRIINTVTGGGTHKGVGLALAKGAYISRGAGPGVDDQLALLALGELVVPSHIVASGAVDHLRGAIPGFSAGGVVGGNMYRAGQAIAGADAQWGQLSAALFAQAAIDAAQKSLAATGGFPGGGAISGGAAAAQRYAASIMGLYGWPQAMMLSLIPLWNGESGWNYLALNPGSGAYGIPQSLPADKMAAAGADWRTNPATQIRWGLGYIKAVYGSPANAYSAWLSRSPHWYDSGGVVSEPVVGVGLRSGDRYGFAMNGVPETVTPGVGTAGGIHIHLDGGVVVREEADVALLASKLAFLINAQGAQ